MLRFNLTTPIAVYAKKQGYVPGEGAITTWERVKSGTFSIFYCEWRGAYGDRLLSAQALGVKELATVRMVFNPALYKAFQTKECVIAKNGDETVLVNGAINMNNVNAYELNAGVDNVAEENQFMEFQVRRYQAK